MTQKVLVIFDGNWADEMDIKGFQLCAKDDWERYTESIPENTTFTHYIGSNQEMEFNGRKDYLRNITVKELTEDEATLLMKLFPHGFGEFVEPDFYQEENEDM